MGESNGAWGELVEHDDEMADVWDGFARLPDQGQNSVFDQFCRSKNISVTALLKVGCKLSTPTVLAFAGPGYIKYRDIVSGERWNYNGVSFRQLKLIPCGEGRSDVVIVCEGETDAARLTMLYPSCDIASLPAGAKTVTNDMIVQLSEYQQVLLGLDQDQAGEAGVKKLKAGLPHAVRFVPPKGDWCETTEPPELPKFVELDRAGGLVFENLSDLLRDGIPDPEVLVDDVLYCSGVHLFSGHPGCGKTTMAAFLAHEAMTQGLHVVWLDYESGKKGTARRLQDSGVPADLVDAQFHYAGWPAEAEKYLADCAQKWPKLLIVLDSMSKALASAGINENDNSEVTTYTVQVVEACKTYELPIIIIDHTKKEGDSDYSRGAGAKLADVDVHWRVVKDSPFNRNTSGSIALKQKKDREGFFPYETWWRVGDGHGKLTLEALESPPGKPDDEPGTTPDI